MKSFSRYVADNSSWVENPTSNQLSVRRLFHSHPWNSRPGVVQRAATMSNRTGRFLPDPSSQIIVTRRAVITIIRRPWPRVTIRPSVCLSDCTPQLPAGDTSLDQHFQKCNETSPVSYNFYFREIHKLRMLLVVKIIQSRDRSNWHSVISLRYWPAF